jgi:predicted transglutaminase-like cysteine proteinase
MQRLAWIVAVLALMSGAARAFDRSGALPSPQDETLRGNPALSAPASAPTGGNVSVPIGWVEFCADAANAGDCVVEPAQARDVVMTRAVQKLVDRINRNVNAAIAPISDMENYGVEERWAYPTNGRGDCEDYVLLKRRLLIEAGVPRQSLLVTVVRDRAGEGHAVLTLTTTKGDYILDNKRDDLRLWTATGYAFVKRQSQEDPNRWVDLRVGASMTAAR